MASSANPEALTAYDISILYFQFYSFSAKTAHDIACLMLGTDNVEHKAFENPLKEEMVKIPDAGIFGRYLARGQTDMVQLKKAVNFEDDAIVNEVQQMMDKTKRQLLPDHPARKDSKLWEAAVAQVKENFAGLRVPVDEQLVLYYDFHGLNFKAIDNILALKGTSSPPFDHYHREKVIASAKRDYAKKVGPEKDAQNLGEYLARGQVSTEDLEKFTGLTAVEIEREIEHLHFGDPIDENHEIHPNNSAVYSVAESKIAENREQFQP